MRDHEAAAETVGIDLARVKVDRVRAQRALRRGGRLAVGARRRGPRTRPKVETFQLSIEFLVAVVIGGAATVLGPMLGGFILVFLQDRIDNSDSLADLFSTRTVRSCSPRRSSASP